MSSTEEQLISFFLYSMFIYPVTNYLVSSKRNYPRWKGGLYAVAFLAIISSCHVYYENREKGPNHYQLLGVFRTSQLSSIKKAYKKLSLELHPDKNKSPTAPSDFNRLKQAYDVLASTENRGIYNRLGDDGVKAASQSVVDSKYITIQLLVYYTSSAIFAFIMTISEPSGDALSYSLLGLASMLLFEFLITIEEMTLPGWCFPSHTPHEIISMMRRLFPAFMNGCRCIMGAFYEDPQAIRYALLVELNSGSRAVALKSYHLVQSVVNYFKRKEAKANKSIQNASLMATNGLDPQSSLYSEQGGVVAAALSEIRQRIEGLPDTAECIRSVEAKAELVKDPHLLRKEQKSNGYSLLWLRNLAIYIIAKVAITAYENSQSKAGAGAGKSSK